MTDFDLTIERTGGSTAVVLAGELDLAMADRLERELDAVLEERPPLLVIDLSSLVFLDATGLRVIIDAHRRAQRDGFRLVLVRGPEQVERLLDLTHMAERLELVDDRAALRAETG